MQFKGLKSGPLLKSQALEFANGDPEIALNLQIIAAVAAGYGEDGFSRADLEFLQEQVYRWRTDAALFNLLSSGKITLRRTPDGRDVRVASVTGGDA